LGVIVFAGFRTHINDFPTFVQEKATPFFFCAIPTLGHFLPFDASTVGVEKIEKVSKQTVNTQSGRLF
jgi:hypothetical protein